MADIIILGQGLEQLTTSALAEGFQVSDSNPILGLESRVNLLRGLGKSLLAQSEVFGPEGRPGNVVGPYTCSISVILAHLNDRLHEEHVERRFDTRNIKILGYTTNPTHTRVAQRSDSRQWSINRRCVATDYFGETK